MGFVKIIYLVLLFFIFPFSHTQGEEGPITVGSKQFTESYILAEILAIKLEDLGYTVDRKYGLGGTMVCWEALLGNQIQLYPEYTGTLKKVILHTEKSLSYTGLRESLSEKGVTLLEPLGFQNSYGFGLSHQLSNKLGITKASQLANHPELRFGVNHEFMKREDGWPSVSQKYGFRQVPTVMHHSLLYDAIRQNRVDVINIFTTDGEIDRFGIQALEEDLHFFPEYQAAYLANRSIRPELLNKLNVLSGTITDQTMRKLNRIAQDTSIENAAREYYKLFPRLLDHRNHGSNTAPMSDLFRSGLEHLGLTVGSVLAAVIIAVPFAIFMRNLPALATPVLYLAGLLQTIPSIALLAFMIPLLGIGVIPAITALFLYALLPVLRNTHAAINSLDPALLITAESLGMSGLQKLFLVEIPLSMPGILAGVRTATIINTGTTTLAAFIGAGGFGEYIVSGLALNNPDLILEGAIPAAIMAIGFELCFEIVERLWIPSHLRQRKN